MPPRLRGFRVERLLGAGGESTVWLARPRRRGPAVALKVVPRRLGDALPEAQALAALDHPNLIKVRAVHRRRHASVLVLDLAAGGTLADLLSRRQRLPAGEVVAVLAPIAAALSAVHAAGLVHGDVSPGNVLFGEDGLPLLSDLGSAYWLDDDAPLSLPAPGFADPLAEHGLVTGQAGDVFSLGAIGFFALTGTVVGSLPSLDANSVNDFATACADALSAVPPELSRLVLAALQVEPGKRPRPVELAAALRHTGPMSGVDLQAGRHTALVPLPVITRGARVPIRAAEARSRSRRRLHWRRAARDMPAPRPSR